MSFVIERLLRRAATEEARLGRVPADTIQALADEGYILDALESDVQLYGDE